MQTYSLGVERQLDEEESKRIANRARGIAYARAAGIAMGVFLLIWLPFNGLRWGGEAPAGLLPAESVVFGLTGILLLLPWKKLEASKGWKPLLILLCFIACAFVFTLVVDLMFQYMMAAEQGAKPPPPAFQSLMLFLVLMQPAVLIFQRRPELLD